MRVLLIEEEPNVIAAVRRNEGLPRLETLDSSIPVSLYEILQRMVHEDPAKRYQTHSELIADLEEVRRQAVEKQVPKTLPAAPGGSKVLFRGALYDCPFAEVLGKIVSEKRSGKLTLSWIDIQKVLHFKDGNIVAALSNQEGERFLDLLRNPLVIRDMADLYFASGSYALAKANYQEVLKEMGDDRHSRNRLKEIEKIRKKK